MHGSELDVHACITESWQRVYNLNVFQRSVI